jgi:hypothetical protein
MEPVILDELKEFLDLGWNMLENYAEYAQAKDDFKVLCVEGIWTPESKKYMDDLHPPYGPNAQPILHPSGRLMVPIVDPETKEPLPGPIYLSMRRDLLVYNTTPGKKGNWIMDHKTAGSQPSERGWDFDDQVTGYSYGEWRLTGILPRGMMANYLIKQLPKPPRLVRKDTALSSAKDQLTLASWYKDAAIAFKLADRKGNWFSEAHAECYNALLSYGWDRFFRRFEMMRNFEEVMSFEARLYEEVKDIQAVVKDPIKAYPNPSIYMNCPSCPVAPICQAMEDGSDWEDVIENRYQQAKDRKAEE